MDRRVVLAVVLMMAVLLVPALLFKPAPRQPDSRTGGRADTGRTLGPLDTLTGRAPAVPPSVGPSVRPSDQLREDTIVVSSPLYRYGFSTRGGRMVEATLLDYPSMRPEERGL
ncbi:MAG TPA: hypothetical protein VGP61_13095, partial [Gemmatimonadales bacterium]|nr:hypothetical protein [Gemmatimonadales bacterium]